MLGKLAPFSKRTLIRFYEISAHNLTISIRATWSDEELSDSQKVERMKWINEIMQRVVLKSAALSARLKLTIGSRHTQYL